MEVLGFHLTGLMLFIDFVSSCILESFRDFGSLERPRPY